jgi:hypothetical protein
MKNLLLDAANLGRLAPSSLWSIFVFLEQIVQNFYGKTKSTLSPQKHKRDDPHHRVFWVIPETIGVVGHDGTPIKNKASNC